MLKYPKDLLTLIAHLKKFPGVGRKTAERFAFQILEWKGQELNDLAELLSTLKERIQSCAECGALMDGVSCSFCSAQNRERHLMCVIATPRDVYAIEETDNFRGVYHVLGALLSPLDGKTPECLNLPHLEERITRLEIKELILALDSTLEGDATALFIREQFPDLQVTRLALGLPLGSSLDFVDEGTLSQAIAGRQKF
ncbi:MAG: Recombination protein RecR [Chlamydiae bacterium]|nr:Recombination protein RecR [Chlamydiota bacterium]